MPIASGVAKQVVLKKETTWGAEGSTGGGPAAGRTGARYLRRKSSTLDLTKDTYQSDEIRTDYQIADMRHGMRRAKGTLEGELSPGSYSDLMQSALRRDFAAVTAATAVGLTIGAAVNGVYPLTRSAGSYVSDGFRIGMVIVLTVGSLNAANISKNLLIVDMTSTTVAKVIPVNGAALVAEGPVTGCTITATGKVTYTPTTGHTDDSYCIEHWYNDISQSELFCGVKVNGFKVSLPPTGIAGVSFDLLGKDLLDTTARRNSIAATTAYFTTPTAASTTGVLAAVNGVLAVQGAIVGLITGMELNENSNMSADPVVGANIAPDIIEGRVMVSGQITVYFQDATLRDLFVNETEARITTAFAVDNTGTSAFIALALPRVKLGGATKTDGEKGSVMTMPFTALAAPSSQTYDFATTLMVQDSLAA